ncbi:MAG: disulfide oxidoreductase, partial [Deinococcus-Thermus bacterium]|nr:disulfide oxidoreductase [Deinococcota bacterium]
MSPAPESTGHGRVFAVLGPTNTGKTHLAIERMLGHASGMIGFPLRLLARENYDKVARLKGRTRVALITGEEKILPPNARYFVCTVESMPLDKPVEFLAVDEIQLCADRERGHVFTQRLLGARGLSETMFLGADTMRGMIRRLVPDAQFVGRPRFSELSYVGEKKLTRLPRRSAVVAFSAADVYHTAELLRRQRGGTAVVLGALSPRTRNAQVEMYQAGEVDYLVATDAIGMGLNMDVDHVAFARLVKFDGQVPRHLRAPEIAQIAGRAGRHMADGTFGTTDGVGGIDEDIVEAVESHTFEPVRHLMWRNSELDFRDPKHLLASLEVRAPVPELKRAPDADDHLSLIALTRDGDLVRRAAGSRPATRLLWEICQIPDFRKTLTDAHTRLLHRVWEQLSGPKGMLDPDWVARQVDALDRGDGDIDTLVQRIAHIRTWTFISHRPHWLADPGHWQQRARAIEDKLSDALHDRLTQRFVDRRSAMLAKTLADGRDLVSAVARSGDVLVEGEYVGHLEGFRFKPDAAEHGEDEKALMSAARRALRQEIARRVKRLEAETDDAAFALDADGTVRWGGEAVGRLAPGDTALTPRAEPLASDLLEPSGRDRVAKRLGRWLDGRVAAGLAPLIRLRDAPLTGNARGLAFQLVEAFGTLPREDVRPLVDA